MITKNLPEGTLDSVASAAGVDSGMIGSILEKGAPMLAGPLSEKVSEEGFLDKAMSAVSGGEGGVLAMVLGSQTDMIAKTIADKVGISESIVKSVLEKVMPFILDAVKSGKINSDMLGAVAGLADGVDMSDITNIAGAVMGGDKKSSGGVMGMLGGLFGKK